MDIITYALCKKIAAHALSGVQSIKVNGVTQTIAADKSVDITVPTVDVDKNYVDREVSSLKEDIKNQIGNINTLLDTINGEMI